MVVLKLEAVKICSSSGGAFNAQGSRIIIVVLKVRSSENL
jgi:hypothetical protein